MIATGSLGVGQHADGMLITPGASHIIFVSPTKLEPLAQENVSDFSLENPIGTIYDRSPGGPTKVVSLLPDNSTPPGTVRFVGTSPDGTDVAFSDETSASLSRYYVRHDDSSTREWARSDGIQAGKELACSGGPDYQWLRNGAPIGGATEATYTAAAADQGSVLQCEVTNSSSEGQSIATSSSRVIVAPFTGKNPPTPGSIGVQPSGGSSERAEVGKELTCQSNGWEGSPTLSFQWFRSGTEIPGASAPAYTPVTADQDAALQCRVIGTNSDGTVVQFSAVTRILATVPVATANPAVSNLTDPGASPEAGDELSCTPGTWANGPSFAYQWLRSGAEIASATASTYTVVAEDEGEVLQCALAGSNAAGSTKAISAELIADPQPGTEPPQLVTVGEVFGQGEVDSALFCQEGSWNNSPTLAYQWLRNGVAIPGATETAYTPVAADLGKTIECQVTATNAGGSVVAVNAAQVKYVVPSIPTASASLPIGGAGQAPPVIYAGTYGGQIFYGDVGQSSRAEPQEPGDLFSFDIATGATTRITDVGDARFSHVSRDGSHVYFVSESPIGGEGSAGEPNLYVWARAGDSTKLIATVSAEDLSGFGGVSDVPQLVNWTEEISAPKGASFGLGNSNTRATPDGSVFLFESKGQLTSFDNSEASAGDCHEREVPGERCIEIYRYDTASETLTCVSCPQGSLGPATGEASMRFGSEGKLGYNSAINPVSNLSEDGDAVFFESTEGLSSEDGNGHADVYRWREGAGPALISTGLSLADSRLYEVSPDGRDVLFVTSEPLLPQDHNGGTPRIYDARINGGFAPPESTVTEPCGGDACQGNPAAAPEAPQTASSSLSGGGNVATRPHCAKQKRRVSHRGKQRCVTRHHRRAHHKRGGSR